MAYQQSPRSTPPAQYRPPQQQTYQAPRSKAPRQPQSYSPNAPAQTGLSCLSKLAILVIVLAVAIAVGVGVGKQIAKHHASSNNTGRGFGPGGSARPPVAAQVIDGAGTSASVF